MKFSKTAAKCACFILLLISAHAFAGDAPLAGMLGVDGALTLSVQGQELCSMRPGLYEKGWKGAGATPPKSAPEDGARHFVIHTSNGTLVNGRVVSKTEGIKDGVNLTFEFTPAADIELNSLNASMIFSVPSLVGGKWTADEKSGVFPAEFNEKEISLQSAPIKSLTLETPKGVTLSMEFAQATPVLLQDDRKWGQSFTVRIGPQADGKLFKKDATESFQFTLTVKPGLTLEIDAPVILKAGPDWIPLTLEQEIEPGSALDFSTQGFHDAPAGKHGRVIATKDGHFAFADSPTVPRRFYGANLCFGAQYLTHEQSDKLAERLMRLGYNAMRIHHYDGDLTKDQPVSTQLNPEKLDQLDYLLAAFKQRGIYVTTDLFVSRPVKWKDLNIDKPGIVPMDVFKILVPILPAAWENWKAFSKALLDHTNPFTKLRYADDPAVAWLSMINEGNLGNNMGGLKAVPEWSKAWNAWLAAKYKTRDALAAAWAAVLKAEEDPEKGSVTLPDNIHAGGARESDCVLFFTDTEKDMIVKMKSFMHDELKCAALITNTNSWTNFAPYQIARAEYDYCDDHFYVDHPQFIETPWRLPSRCPNTSPIAAGAPGGCNCAFTRLYGKPFTITEYNYAAPGQYRGVGGVLTGALAALQDWSGVWRFAYSHDPKNLFEDKPMNYFDMADDPLSQAAERAAMCLFVRGDMKAAPDALNGDIAGGATPGHATPLCPRWTWAAWILRIQTGLKNPQPAPGDTEVAINADESHVIEELRKSALKNNPSDPAKHILRSETSEFSVDGPSNTLVINTPRTAGGFAPAGKSVVTEDKRVSIAVAGIDASVWLSSLDNKPLTESSRILVTHLTDLQNTEIHYAEKARKTLLDWGKAPHLVREGKATIQLKRADADKLKVWALATSGKRLFEVKTSATNGMLEFTVDVAQNSADSGAHFCYEIAPQ